MAIAIATSKGYLSVDNDGVAQHTNMVDSAHQFPNLVEAKSWVEKHGNANLPTFQPSEVSFVVC